MKILEAMVAWNPNGEIKVGEWPDTNGWSDEFKNTSGACYSSWHEMMRISLKAASYSGRIRPCISLKAVIGAERRSAKKTYVM